MSIRPFFFYLGKRSLLESKEAVCRWLFENVHCSVRKIDRFAYASLYETVSEIIDSVYQGCDLFEWFSAREVSQVGHGHKNKQLCKHCLGIHLCPWNRRRKFPTE